MKRLHLALAVAAAFSVPSVAFSQESTLTLKGFGTLGVVHNGSDEADFVANDTFQPNGAGRTRNNAFGVDSKLGVQADWKFASNFSATVQLLSKQSVENSYAPQVEWGFVKYSATPDLDIRVGRIRPAIYMLSDFLDVNYANPWVRPPMEFYDSAPVSHIEGIDMLWRTNIGETSILIQPYAGSSNLEMPDRAEMKIRKIVGINVTASTGDFTYRFGHISTKVSVKSDGLNAPFGGLDAYCGFGDDVACAQAAALAPTYKNASFTSIGIGYDNGDYFASGEFGKRATAMFINDAKTWYVTAGKHIGQWTPYVTYSTYRSDNPDSFSGSVNSDVNAIVTGMYQNNPLDQSTFTIGTRYDLMKNIALKAQFDHVMTDKLSAGGSGKGMTQNATAAFKSKDRTLNVLSLSLDFVF